MQTVRKKDMKIKHEKPSEMSTEKVVEVFAEVQVAQVIAPGALNFRALSVLIKMYSTEQARVTTIAIPIEYIFTGREAEPKRARKILTSTVSSPFRCYIFLHGKKPCSPKPVSFHVRGDRQRALTSKTLSSTYEKPP